MKFYYDSEEEFMADYNGEFDDPPVYSKSEQRKRHNAITNMAMRAKWAKSLLRECPHSGVYVKYGTSTVPVWICFGCQYAHRYPTHGGVSCDYGKQ